MDESSLNIFETFPETGAADEYDKACKVLNANFNSLFGIYYASISPQFRTVQECDFDRQL